MPNIGIVPDHPDDVLIPSLEVPHDEEYPPPIQGELEEVPVYPDDWVADEDLPGEDSDGIVEDEEHNRRKMNSLGHCLDHTPSIPGCPGCDAKARNKKHMRNSFDVDNSRYANCVTGDQVTFADFQ